MTDDFTPVDSDEFVPYPYEPRWGGHGPTDRNAAPLDSSTLGEEYAENDDGSHHAN